MTRKPRARELGLALPGTPGRWNAITDVPGLAVGVTTLLEGKGPLDPGKGPVRTGVTAILPRADADDLVPSWAGFYALNGNGEMTGTHWIADAGYFAGPICLTNTHSVGLVHHAAVAWMVARYRQRFTENHLWALPVVAETYDGVLNDINGQHVKEAHVFAALDGARSGPVAEGNVGGGTGMICYDFKGGTGTASRRLTVGGREGHLGALVQANHGRRDWLTILGAPVGRHLAEDRLLQQEQGSIIVVLATDLPLLPHQLRRLAKRAAIGIGRGGTPGGNNSGDLFLAVSVGNPLPLAQFAPPLWQLEAVNDELFDPIYEAAVETVEEAVINALLAAEDMESLRPPGRIVRALDHGRLVEILGRYGRAPHRPRGTSPATAITSEQGRGS